MNTSILFDELKIGDYFSVPGSPGVLCEKIKYESWGEGMVRGGYNSRILMHPRKESVNCGDYCMPDMAVVREAREKYLKPFSSIGIGKRAALREEPTTILKRIRPKKLRGGKIVNAAVVAMGIVKTKLMERSRGRSSGYLFVRPDEQLLVA